MQTPTLIEQCATDARAQALLKLLGSHAQVIEYEITPDAIDTAYATFWATFQNGCQARGYIMRIHDKWYAGGSVITASQAARIAEMQRWLGECGHMEGKQP